MLCALGFRVSLSNQTPFPNSAEIMALCKTSLRHEFAEKKCCYSSLKSCRCVDACACAPVCADAQVCVKYLSFCSQGSEWNPGLFNFYKNLHWFSAIKSTVLCFKAALTERRWCFSIYKPNKQPRLNQPCEISPAEKPTTCLSYRQMHRLAKSYHERDKSCTGINTVTSHQPLWSNVLSCACEKSAAKGWTKKESTTNIIWKRNTAAIGGRDSKDKEVWEKHARDRQRGVFATHHAHRSAFATWQVWVTSEFRWGYALTGRVDSLGRTPLTDLPAD